MHYFCGVLIMKCMLLYLEIMGGVVRYTVSSCRPPFRPYFLMLVVYIYQGVGESYYLDKNRAYCIIIGLI